MRKYNMKAKMFATKSGNWFTQKNASIQFRQIIERDPKLQLVSIV